MNKFEFIQKVIRKICEMGFDYQIKDDRLYLLKRKKVLTSGNIDVLFRGYQSSPSFEAFWLGTLRYLTTPTSINAILPVVMNQKEYDFLGVNTIAKDPLICDLFVVYSDVNNRAFILMDEYKQIKNINTTAFNNLDQILRSIDKLYGNHRKYKNILSVCHSGNLIIPSFIFSQYFKNKISKEIGDEYIFVSPNNCSLLFTAYNKQNYADIIKVLNEVPSEQITSTTIYLYNKGTYSILAREIDKS